MAFSFASQLVLIMRSAFVLLTLSLAGAGFAQELPTITGNRLLRIDDNRAFLSVWGHFDVADSDGVYRRSGEAQLYYRYPGQDWQILSGRGESWIHGRFYQFNVHPVGFEMKACRVDGVCSLPYLAKTTPIYSGEKTIKKNPGQKDRSIKLYGGQFFGGPYQIVVYKRSVSTYPYYSDKVWYAESVSCTADTCVGLLPYEVINSPGTYKVSLHTRTGQFDERDHPELVVIAPMKVLQRFTPPIDVDFDLLEVQP